MTSRRAVTSWDGGLQSGKGTVTFSSSNVGQHEVTFPRRIGDPEGTTSPEEMIAAAQSSCLAMNLAGTLDKEGLSAKSLEVDAEVTIESQDSGLGISTVAITLRADVDGVDDDRFQQLAQQAKQTCPVSKALAGTTITLDAALGSAQTMT